MHQFSRHLIRRITRHGCQHIDHSRILTSWGKRHKWRNSRSCRLLKCSICHFTFILSFQRKNPICSNSWYRFNRILNLLNSHLSKRIRRLIKWILKQVKYFLAYSHLLRYSSFIVSFCRGDIIKILDTKRSSILHNWWSIPSDWRNFWLLTHFKDALGSKWSTLVNLIWKCLFLCCGRNHRLLGHCIAIVECFDRNSWSFTCHIQYK